MREEYFVSKALNIFINEGNIPKINKFSNDKNNICFICQLSRDKCLLKNIDFDSHIKNEHNLWNYVNFLIFLHLNNPNDFSRFEGLVWDKLLERDFGWISVDSDVGEEDD